LVDRPCVTEALSEKKNVQLIKSDSGNEHPILLIEHYNSNYVTV
jgi:hypothetical protein